ncbi:NFATC2-interacting protein isoform X2 [Etheostoma spectabile]|uniref:NFATC2-interacting protein isoform X2 n=1 Tax=Etheostoma spectabile TaxID=54343 RepID=UPI0013AF5794|nr:NFATC2-interacting protein isoform X2 [Etheostoma spectabile]
MAEAVSDSEQPAAKPAPKRRRILDPSAIVSVPVYSNKVSSSLQLKPTADMFTGKENSDDVADDALWSPFSSPTRSSGDVVVGLSDSEDEADRVETKTEPAAMRCPSPPQSPVQKQSRQVQRKISEIDRKLRAVNSLLSPDPQDSRSRTSRSCNDDVLIINPNDDSITHPDDDDVLILNPDPGLQDSPYSSLVREIPLKIRCRTDVHKIQVQSSTPLKDVVTQLSSVLAVPPARLLLLRDDVELPTHATVGELGLGIADIIECVVMAAEDEGGADSSRTITVRLQSKDRDSSQEFSLHRDAPLGSVFSQYLSRMSTVPQKPVRFHFDGCKVSPSQTPAQLDMEDGDIIEVWL